MHCQRNAARQIEDTMTAMIRAILVVALTAAAAAVAAVPAAPGVDVGDGRAVEMRVTIEDMRK
jgi:hypothetical protein